MRDIVILFLMSDDLSIHLIDGRRKNNKYMISLYYSRKRSFSNFMNKSQSKNVGVWAHIDPMTV